jgi:hypothetical protein
MTWDEKNLVALKRYCKAIRIAKLRLDAATEEYNKASEVAWAEYNGFSRARPALWLTALL